MFLPLRILYSSCVYECVGVCVCVDTVEKNRFGSVYSMVPQCVTFVEAGGRPWCVQFSVL